MTPHTDPKSALLALETTAKSLSFVALVQHLERAMPGGARVGELGPLSAETIRFHHDVQPIFHAGDVTRLKFVDSGEGVVAEITTAFVGIVGSVSPIASFFTEELLRGAAEDESALRAFYDLFHHRLIALLYRARLRGSPAAEIRTDTDDRCTFRSLSMAGIEGALFGPQTVSARRWLGLARVVARRPSSRDALAAALSLAYPDLPIQIRDFLPRDFALTEDQRVQLGVRTVTLGRGLRLGRHMLRQTGFVRLEIGPVGRAACDSFFPGGAEHVRLRRVTEAITGPMIDVEVEIEIAVGDEPRARLGERFSTRLGTNGLVMRPATDRPVRARLSLSSEGARPSFAADRG
jgi:type VI secretion system protein ImpH